MENTTNDEKLCNSDPESIIDRFLEGISRKVIGLTPSYGKEPIRTMLHRTSYSATILAFHDNSIFFCFYQNDLY